MALARRTHTCKWMALERRPYISEKGWRSRVGTRPRASGPNPVLWSVCLSAYLLTYLRTYLLTHLLTYLLTYLLSRTLGR